MEHVSNAAWTGIGLHGGIDLGSRGNPEGLSRYDSSILRQELISAPGQNAKNSI